MWGGVTYAGATSTPSGMYYSNARPGGGLGSQPTIAGTSYPYAGVSPVYTTTTYTPINYHAPDPSFAAPSTPKAFASYAVTGHAYTGLPTTTVTSYTPISQQQHQQQQPQQQYAPQGHPQPQPQQQQQQPQQGPTQYQYQGYQGYAAGGGFSRIPSSSSGSAGAVFSFPSPSGAGQYRTGPTYTAAGPVYTSVSCTPSPHPPSGFRSASVPSRRLSGSYDTCCNPQNAPVTVRRQSGAISACAGSRVRSASAPRTLSPRAEEAAAPPPRPAPPMPSVRSWVAAYPHPAPAHQEAPLGRTVRTLFPTPLMPAPPRTPEPAPSRTPVRVAEPTTPLSARSGSTASHHSAWESRPPAAAPAAPYPGSHGGSTPATPTATTPGRALPPRPVASNTFVAPRPVPPAPAPTFTAPARTPTAPAAPAAAAAAAPRGRLYSQADGQPHAVRRSVSAPATAAKRVPSEEPPPAQNGDGPPQAPFRAAAKKTLPSDKAIWQEYEKMQQIGQGMSGQVWRAYHRQTHTYYAMKVMEKETFQPQFMHHVLQMEMNLQAAMDHPYIVKVAHVYDTPKMVVLVMPFFKNGDLTSAFKTRTVAPFGEAIVRMWTAQVISALGYLHQHSILYGDMKPDNVLLDANFYAHLTDFGLSRWVPSGKHLGRRGFGMPNSYLSPEMIKGEPYGPEADLWALGILMYLMALGHHPFIGPGDSLTDCEAIHSRMIGPDPAEVPPGAMSAAGADFFIKLLQKPVGARLASCGAARAHPWLAPLDWAALDAKRFPCPGLDEPL